MDLLHTFYMFQNITFEKILETETKVGRHLFLSSIRTNGGKVDSGCP